MLKIRISTMEKTSVDTPIVDGELLSTAIERCLKDGLGIQDSKEIQDSLIVLVNGLETPKELWPTVALKESDTVVAVPKIESSGTKLAISAVVGIIVGVIFTPAAGMIAFSITNTLLNLLIPTPVDGLPELGNIGSESIESSQMYAITSQSNAPNKYGIVPKVYGRHRFHPPVAASPYSEIEVDQNTGKTVQYFYGIYDLGMGPLTVTDVKIGDTPITDFVETSYRLVDPNRPTISEGTWDDFLETDFTLYKGEVESENLSLAINGNQANGAPLSEYQILRTCTAAVEGNVQEIILDFTCPQGLIAFNTAGTATTRNIDLEIHFSKVGEDIWRGYNDFAYVDNFRSVGGSVVYDNTELALRPFVRTDYVQLSDSGYSAHQYNGSIGYTRTQTRTMGFPAGASTFILQDVGLLVGDMVGLADGTYRRRVLSKTPHSPGFSTYVLDAPGLHKNVPVFDVLETLVHDNAFATDTITYEIKGTPSPLATFRLVRPSNSKARISRSEPNQTYATFRFTPTEVAQYKVRIVRKSASSDYTFSVRDSLVLTTLSSRFDRIPIRSTKRHVFLEMRIKATSQLNGGINSLSAICSSVLDVWDGSVWTKQVSNNPAWVFADLLTGEVNKRAISKDRLHTDSLLEWADYCDEVPPSPTVGDFTFPRFQTNMILDFATTLQGILNMVANAGHASLNIIDGKYGVMVDKLKTTPVQVFTPRNSWDFSSDRSFDEVPDAYRVKYVDPDSDWQLSDVIAYNDGFNLASAVNIEDLESFACTNPEQAFRLGRYHLAQRTLRRERISITVDFENLVCTRGDFVQITQDVMKTGGRPARVKSVSGIRITIDDQIDTLVASYGYVARKSDNTIVTSTLTVIDAQTFDLDGVMPAVGDLIVIGEVGEIIMDCVVHSIIPGDELTATLVLLEKADAIYDAENGMDIPDYDPQLSSVADTDLAAPGEVQFLQVVNNTYRVVGRQYQYYVDIDWNVPVVGSAYASFEVYVDSDAGYEFVDVVTESNYQYIVDLQKLGIEHKFKVLAISATGKKLNLGEVGFVSATPLRKTSPPSDVVALYLNILGEGLQLEWPPIADLDVERYIIRYSPVIDEVWERSIPLMSAADNMTMAMTQARTGTYFIKARDFNGNESLLSAKAFTSIPNLFNLNIIEETNDFPTLPGNKVAVVSDGTSLLLAEQVAGSQYYSSGYYYYENHLDLGEIYSVRIQSLIEAEGFTFGDLMSNWVTLDSVLFMSNTRSSEWDVETQLRYTNQYNVMSEWVDLDSIDPISEGNQDIWNDWRKFTIGDYTGRIFQFRLKLISNAPAVTPRVFEGKIRSDMPDRLDSYNNIVSGVGTYTLTYSVPFNGPGTTPAIQITQDDAENGDYYKLSNRTLLSFDITFYDSGDNIVSRQFDAMVKGFGRLNTYVI